MSQFFRVAGVMTIVAAALAPAAASADDGFAFNVGAVTDYRYRGLSQSRVAPAAQGGVDFAQGGFYAGTWASTIKWIKDTGTDNGFDAGNANVEVDLYGGYKGSINKDLSFDVGLLSYQYFGNKLDRDSRFVDATTNEVYGALTFGPVTAKYSHAFSDLFGNPDSDGSGYADLSASFEWEGLTLVPHIGHQKIKGPNSGFSYTDYSFTVSKDFKGVVVSGSIVDTDLDVNLGGKNIGKSAFVLGVKYNF